MIGQADENGLVKPKAYVVLCPDITPTAELTAAPYKYPRWIEFVADLPRTATGEIQRFKLRGKY